MGRGNVRSRDGPKKARHMTDRTSEIVEAMADCPLCEYGSDFCAVSVHGCGGAKVIPARAAAIFASEAFKKEVSNPATRLHLALSALTASEPLLAQAKREAFEEAAKVAELHIPERNLSVSDLSARATARTIADNIRALAQSEGEGKA
jgi:hypothetical protein